LKKPIKTFSLNEKFIPHHLIKELTVSKTSDDLSKKILKDGYIFIRNIYKKDDIENARDKVLKHLHTVGEVKDPYNQGIFSGKSKRNELYPTNFELGKFWKEISESKQLRKVINGKEITKIFEQIFNQKVIHFSFAWLRAVIKGKASPLHIDHPYMSRGSDKLLTCWTPLSKIKQNEGPLFILENSHKWRDIKLNFLNHDIDINSDKPGHIVENTLDLVLRKKSYFLTSNFEPGDCLIFGMFTVHGSFDNNTTTGKIRLSCDTRFQPYSDPMDPRFSGHNPPAHKNLGYGCLSSSAPLTDNIKNK
tara:strand:+ start:338 stop:1252 length:915 start_codon:yes stop_codon:yes gene_type:complete